jgi:hypothetical protein
MVFREGTGRIDSLQSTTPTQSQEGSTTLTKWPYNWFTALKINADRAQPRTGVPRDYGATPEHGGFDLFQLEMFRLSVLVCVCVFPASM